VAVSDDLQEEKPSVQEGSDVIYGKYAGTEFSFDGEDYLIMRESDIYATLN
jgi:chaperonin GroES